MSIARRRSIGAIAAFRKQYVADHPGVSRGDAGLAYVMQAGRQRIGVINGQAALDRGNAADYAAFVDAVRTSAAGAPEPPRGLKWPQARAMIRATLGS